MPVHILVECPALIASVRVGVLDPLKPLEDQGKCNIKFIKTVQIKKKDICWSDILVSVRGFEKISADIARVAKQAGRFVIYFLDDDLLNIPDDVGSKKYFSDPERRQALHDIISLSDVLWCVNSKLGEKYSKIFNNKKWVLERVPVSAPLVSNSTIEHNQVNVLYAGSSDHTPIIREYISPVVDHISKEFGSSVFFTFIGVDPGLPENKSVEYIKFFDSYDDYCLFLSEKSFDIGLAPIRTSEFYQCKYYNKYVEYSKLGVVGLYTNIAPYTLVVHNGVNGFLCDNTFDDWYNTLKKVIEDKMLRKNKAKVAQNDLRENFSNQAVLTQLLADIPELEGYYAQFVRPMKIHLGNPFIHFYSGRLQLLLKGKGLKAIPIIFLKAFRKFIKIINRR